MRAFILLLGPLVSGCVPLDRLAIALPEESRANSYVVVIDDQDPVAFAKSGRVEASSQGGWFVLLGYSESLGELDLPEGRVQAQACRPCSVGHPDEVWLARLEDGAPTPWVSRDAIPEDVHRVLIPDASPRCDACQPYRVSHRAEVGSPGEARSVLTIAPHPDEGDRVLIATILDGLFSMGSDGSLTRICANPNGHSDPWTSMFVRGEEIWFAAESNGRIYRARISSLDPADCYRGLSPDAELGETVEDFAGPSITSSAALEVFAIGRGTGLVARYRTDWQVLGALPGGTVEALEWVGPGTVYAVGALPEVTVIQETAWEQRPLRSGAVIKATPLSVRQTESLGVLLGTDNHLLYREDERREFVPLLEEQIVAEVEARVIVESEGRILFSTRSGGLMQFVPGHGYCDELLLFRDQEVETARVLDDGTIAFGGEHDVFIIDRPRQCESAR